MLMAKSLFFHDSRGLLVLTIIHIMFCVHTVFCFYRSVPIFVFSVLIFVSAFGIKIMKIM
jgi:hypothetical protein